MDLQSSAFTSSGDFSDTESLLAQVKSLMQMISQRDYQICELQKKKGDYLDQLRTLRLEIYLRDQALEKNKEEREKFLSIIKRLVCSYEANYQFKCDVEDLLRRETDFRGTDHPSTKLSFDQITALRGGM